MPQIAWILNLKGVLIAVNMARSERHAAWESEQKVVELTQRVNSAETALGRVARERDAAIDAGFSNEAEARGLRTQLAVRNAEVRELTEQLDQTRTVIDATALTSEGTLAEVYTLSAEVSELRQENTRLSAESAVQGLENGQLLARNLELEREVTRRKDVDAENGELREDVRFWRSRANQYSSQVGNFLVGFGKIPTTTLILEAVKDTPLGSLLGSASARLHQNHQANQKNGKSH